MFNITKSYCPKMDTTRKFSWIFMSQPYVCHSVLVLIMIMLLLTAKIYVYPMEHMSSSVYTTIRDVYSMQQLNCYMSILLLCEHWYFINHLVLIQPPPARLFRGSKPAPKLTPANPTTKPYNNNNNQPTRTLSTLQAASLAKWYRFTEIQLVPKRKRKWRDSEASNSGARGSIINMTPGNI